MKSIRLSICIATYNRANFIGETLDNIISQLTDEVEIIIADGASTDKTEEVINSYCKRCPQINYVRLPFKGGVDQDYCKAVEKAKGKFCWLFTDDDLLAPNSIQRILKELNNNYSLIVINAKVMNKDFSKVIDPKRMHIDEDEIFSSSEMDLLFKRAIAYMSFIGSIVINRNLWMEREKEKYFETEFIHIGVIFQKSLPQSTLVIAEPFIQIRYENAQWSPRAMEIWIKKWPKLLFSFNHIKEEYRNKYQLTNPWVRFKRIVLIREMEAYNYKEYKKWFLTDEYSFIWKVFAFIIAIIPSCVLKWFMILYRNLINILTQQKKG